MPIWYLKSLIDRMENLNLNRLHLHLTDDQGWRFESIKYPRLHEVGSVRRETVVGKQFHFFNNKYKGDGKVYGGYYKQSELKELVTYAKRKGIDIVPEIDLPGHSTALLYAYPEYSFGEPPREVATYWGVFNNVLKTDDQTLDFVFDIFDELMEVFDSKYIHIGGDEVHVPGYDKDYILLRLAKYLVDCGRVPVVWDEAWEIAKEYDGVVMVWHSLTDLSKIINNQVYAICCSSSHLYFDYYKSPNIKSEPIAIGGYIPVEKVRELGVALSNNKFINSQNKKFLLGVQGQIWTEYMPSPKDVDYMIEGRLEALSDVASGKLI